MVPTVQDFYTKQDDRCSKEIGCLETTMRQTKMKKYQE